MAKVAIIYYSQTGTTHKLAQGVEEGARGAGAEIRLLRVKETAPDEAALTAARLQGKRVAELAAKFV